MIKKENVINYYNNSKKIIDEDSLTDEYRGWLSVELEEMGKNIHQNAKVLEIGVGNGRVMDFLDNGYRKLIGIDIADISKLKEKYKESNNIEIYEMDAERLEFEDNFFDCAVVAYNTLGLMNNHEKVLNEIKRVVDDNGVILISTYELDENYCLSERVKCFKKIGHDVKINKLQLDVSNGVASYYFTRRELINLFEKLDLGVEYISLTKLGCLWKITKAI